MAIPTLSMRNPGALGSKVAGSRWFEQEKKKSIPRVQAFILQQNCIYSLNVLCRAWQRAWAELWTFLSDTGVSGLIPRQQCLRFPEKGLWFLWFLVCSYLGTVSGSWGMSLSSWGCRWLQGTSVPPVEPGFSPGGSFWGTVNILCSHCLSAPPPVGDLGFPTSLVLRSCARPRKLCRAGSPQPAKGYFSHASSELATLPALSRLCSYKWLFIFPNHGVKSSQFQNSSRNSWRISLGLWLVRLSSGRMREF